MDIINKIDKLLGDETGATMTGNVATNLAKGHVDVIGGVRRGVSSIGYQCPKGQVWDKSTRKCVPSKNESARSPKAGDKFEYKGKKLTIVKVGSGMGHDKYITVQFDNEKHRREISMKNFFKGNEFKYIGESSVVGGSYLAGSTVNIVGSGQTRVWGDRLRWMIDLDRKEPVEKEVSDKTKQNIEMRKGLQFNNILGAYVPQGDTEIEPRYVDLIKGEIG